MNQVLEYQAEVFGNRLKKRHKHLRKWARRNDISCFRVYDRDIPETPLVVDLYENYLHIAEFGGREKPLPAPAEEYRAAMKDIARRALGIQADRTFYKEKRRTSGNDQYERLDQRQTFYTVSEGGLRFRVNFTDYLDTGLFLDHRQTRSMMRELVQELTVERPVRALNLFSYTGSFSVYAAQGGALHTVSVDMSRTYSDWARENLVLNNMSNERNIVVSDDVFKFLDQPDTRQYDLVILDPPTFSNSKKMTRVLDVQRDHVELVRLCGEFLRPGGFLLFSTNKRKFALEDSKLRGFQISDITAETIPEDFRDKKIHRCWLMEKRR